MDLTTSPGDAMKQGHATRKYHPILEIGSGGMSRVYLTVVRGPAGFNKFQVVKRLLPSLASDPEFLNMFLEEARLSARLNHANVVQINEVGFDGEHHFMAMEYLEGQSLESLVRRASRQGGLPLPLHLRVLAEAAAGLHYAHEFADIDGRPLNIVHRDVSPHNVFVTYQGQVKVLDFGIAKAADSSLHTRTGMLKGKVAYMAPEQLRQGPALDRRADVFALGVMLWQAIAGRRLWQDMSDLEVFQQLNARQIPSLRDAVPGAPAALVQICERALAFEPRDRFATAAELGDAIEGYLSAQSHRVSGRELGAYATQLFAAKRAEVQGLIEVALSRRPDSSMPPPAVPPALTPPLGSRPESGLLPPAQFGPASDARVEAQRSSSNGLDAALWTLPAPPPAPSFVEGGLPPRRGASTGRWLWPTAVAVTLGASVASFFIVQRSLRSPPGRPAAPAAVEVAAAAPPPAPASSSASAASSAAPRRTLLVVRASPPNARLLVDNVPLSTNPGTATFVSDGMPHQVRAEAPGFVGEAKVVIYDKNEESVSFQLQRERKAPSAWHPSPGKASGAAAAPAVVATPTPSPKAETTKTGPPKLDRESPWP